jgi:transcriptional regulator with XRE-family HTH domain
MQATAKRSGSVRINVGKLDREEARRGITDRELADKAGVSKSAISDARRRPVLASTYRKITQALLTFPPVEGADVLLDDEAEAS